MLTKFSPPIFSPQSKPHLFQTVSLLWLIYLNYICHCLLVSKNEFYVECAVTLVTLVTCECIKTITFHHKKSSFLMNLPPALCVPIGFNHPYGNENFLNSRTWCILVNVLTISSCILIWIASITNHIIFHKTFPPSIDW